MFFYGFKKYFRAYNYGSFGYILGHEFAHVFDSPSLILF